MFVLIFYNEHLPIYGSINYKQASCTWALLLHYSPFIFLNILHTLDFCLHFLDCQPIQNSLLISSTCCLSCFPDFLMGLLNKVGPYSNWCFYSGPFHKIICFMVKVSFHYFSVVFGDPFSPLPCSELSNGTLIRFTDVNSTCREEEAFHININTSRKSFIICM